MTAAFQSTLWPVSACIECMLHSALDRWTCSHANQPAMSAKFSPACLPHSTGLCH